VKCSHPSRWRLFQFLMKYLVSNKTFVKWNLEGHPKGLTWTRCSSWHQHCSFHRTSAWTELWVRHFHFQASWPPTTSPAGPPGYPERIEALCGCISTLRFPRSCFSWTGPSYSILSRPSNAPTSAIYSSRVTNWVATISDTYIHDHDLQGTYHS
jgi:hypothetical protein